MGDKGGKKDKDKDQKQKTIQSGFLSVRLDSELSQE